MAVWQQEETIKLLDLWSEENIQALLEGCARNKTVYDKLAEDMAGHGYNRTGGQCCEHIKKLKKGFKKTKDNLKQTGNGNRRKQCKFFDKLNEILGERPSIQPAVVIDSSFSSMNTSIASTTESLDSEEEQSNEVCEEGKRPDNLGNPPSEGQTPHAEGSVQSDSIKGETQPKGSQSEGENKKKTVDKKRLTREEQLEKTMNGMMDKVLKHQQDSDDKFMELETKRMKLEEKMMELENGRRREERALQFRLFSMMYQGSPYQSSAMNYALSMMPPPFDTSGGSMHTTLHLCYQTCLIISLVIFQ